MAPHALCDNEIFECFSLYLRSILYPLIAIHVGKGRRRLGFAAHATAEARSTSKQAFVFSMCSDGARLNRTIVVFRCLRSDGCSPCDQPVHPQMAVLFSSSEQLIFAPDSQLRQSQLQNIILQF